MAILIKYFYVDLYAKKIYNYITMMKVSNDYKMFSARIEAKLMRQVKILAAIEDKKIQELLKEAFELLLAQRKKRRGKK